MVSIMKKISIILVLALVVGSGWFIYNRNHSDTAGDPQAANSQKTGAFNKQKHSLNDPTSIWVIANKLRPLTPNNYAPDDLIAPSVPLRLTAKDNEMLMRNEVAHALESMFAAAKKDNLNLMVSSGYRSYGYQVGLYNRYVQQQGKAVADTQSARPGYSEHQTGLAVDVEPASRNCEIEECFGDLPEGKWVAANAYKYGFVVRYPQEKQNITGYIYEPWHIRYVGKELSGEVRKQGNPTLEQFFGLPDAPDYK